jgi:DNA-binding Xre family transcriptional regulator
MTAAAWTPWHRRQEPTLTLPQTQKAGPMSDTASATAPTSDTVSPAVVSAAATMAPISSEAALDLGKFPVAASAPAPTPDSDIQLRMSLLVLAGQLTQLMGRNSVVPEQLAKATGISETVLYSIMTGREPDVGVRTLSVLAKALGVPFGFGLIQPSGAKSA